MYLELLRRKEGSSCLCCQPLQKALCFHQTCLGTTSPVLVTVSGQKEHSLSNVPMTRLTDLLHYAQTPQYSKKIIAHTFYK